MVDSGLLLIGPPEERMESSPPSLSASFASTLVITARKLSVKNEIWISLSTALGSFAKRARTCK